ncbi:hypothetical protein EJ04DRAFT_66882 [Polyplosphaeria fusca]|uniref:Uncharacterized protein n=1 Tax=Polyplosphaeria fusca TaxID=682080 RepID=A0A9P4QLC5_9PLEO|nr:hypothetical protein EJ04DRAFT_66882 [Polyplosphaeria fusca]
MPISTSPILSVSAFIFGTIFLGFGAQYILDPRAAFQNFSPNLKYPALPADAHVMDLVMTLFGAKDLFMGFAIHASLWFGTRRSLGLILVAAAMCAGIDGYVMKTGVGTGEWNHWGYGSAVAVTGLLELGLLG